MEFMGKLTEKNQTSRNTMPL